MHMSESAPSIESGSMPDSIWPMRYLDFDRPMTEAKVSAPAELLCRKQVSRSAADIHYNLVVPASDRGLP